MPNTSASERGARRVRPGAVLGRLVRNLGIIVRDALVAPFAQRLPRDWVVIRLDRGLAEVSPGSNWLDAVRPQPRALATVLELLERAARDSRVKGVLLRVGAAPLGWAKLKSLERALAAYQTSGKLVVVYAESTGNAGAWLGARADRFWMTPEGRVDLLGVRADTPFLRDALERLHIQPDVVQAGRYKGAAEILDRSSMSDDAREALEAVVDELYNALVEALEPRAGSRDKAAAWIDGGPYLAGEAQELGLVDDVLYGDELRARLAVLACSDGKAREVGLMLDHVYERVSRRRFDLEPLIEGRDEIAVVNIQGVIRSPDRSARPVVALLRRLARRDRVRAVVLRINSPGGDPLASDLIWRAVGQLRDKKPVVASLSDTAASGGYYVAMAANEVVAESTTLTGSIGVVLAGLVLDDLIAHLGVNFDGVQRGRHAGIYDPFRQRSDEERALLERHVAKLYATFVEKAARGRGCEPDELEKVAQGRVWTGAQALENGLVDRLGGPEAALARARELAGLSPSAGVPVPLAPQLSFLQRLRGGESLGSRMNLEVLGTCQLLCPIEIPLR